MDRGLLLSEDIKSKCWPWAPFYPARQIAAPALSDPVWQFAPWLEFARREIGAGRMPLWNPHQDGGVPLLGNAQSALGSPLLWPVLLFGVAGAWNLSLLLRVLLALCGTYLWLRDMGRSRAAAALGATAFALSGPFIAWLEHPATLAAAPVPLLLFFARRVSRGRRRDFLGLAFTTYLVLSGGHPETQLMAALLAGSLLLVFPPVGFARTMRACLLGAGLAAPLLFPFFEYFRLSQARLGMGRRPFTIPLRDLLRFLHVGRPGSNVIEGAATVSVTLLLLVPFGVVLARRDRAALWACLTAATMLAVIYQNPIAEALALHTPVHWSRALLLLPLPLALLASGGLDALRARWKARGEPHRFLRPAAWGPALVCAVELLTAGRGVHGSTPPGRLAGATPMLQALAADRDVFRILPLHTFLHSDTATEYGLDEVRGFDAVSPRGWRAKREEMGHFTSVPTEDDVLEPWDIAPGGAALDFWNVKYLLMAPQFGFGAETLNAKKGLDLELIYSGPDGRILRNRRVLPRARLSVPGEVRILERGPLRWRFDVAAQRAGTLLVANPGFPGWEARVNGKGVALEKPPGDAIELPVPAGRLRVDLVYRPLSFRLGVLVAAASLLLLLVSAVRRPGVEA